jgi:hypothetical protein
MPKAQASTAWADKSAALLFAAQKTPFIDFGTLGVVILSHLN